jgi:tetratricopeptide (TPR) repeat protein
MAEGSISEARRLLAQGRLDEARALLERAVTAAPLDPAARIALADLLVTSRRPDLALRVCEAGLQRLGADAGLLCAKARALQNVSRVAEAEAAYRQALQLDPTRAEARYGLALQATEAGDWDAAQALVQAIPGPRGPAFGWLAARIALGRADFASAAEAARETLSAAGLGPEQHAETELLLGEALDGLGRHAEAFAAFSRGKQTQRGFYAERAAGREAEADKLDRLAAWFGAADPAPWRTAPNAPTDPARPGHVFLVGFPRSGTTLLEQALAGHPRLAALEEAPTLAEAYAEFMTGPDGLERLARLAGAEAARWRAAYWAAVDKGCPEARGRVFLDKAPAGTLYLPLVAKLFPDASVLFALRDPRDVALSCFRSGFQMNALTYAFTDLAETARCYGASMAMAQVYRRVLPLRVMDVRYERLVDDFAGELGRITDFLGLDPAPGMTDVAATARRRVVRTPSAAQVRAGLNRRGLGRWRAYADELAPILPLLAPWVEAFGYGGSG